jgi:tRNA threonylcarbamoyladenosine biosynthesis protein TsaE
MTAVRTTSPDETLGLGRRFGAGLRRGDVVALTGELGSGKTQFVKGVCAAFHVHDPVTSPTFVLLNRYAGRNAEGAELLIYHLDLYRIRSVAEVYDLGVEEILGGDGVCLIEWAEALQGLLPARHHEVRLGHGDAENVRYVEIIPAEGNG